RPEPRPRPDPPRAPIPSPDRPRCLGPPGPTGGGPARRRRAIIPGLAECIGSMHSPKSTHTRRPPDLDAQEIKTAVAQQAAARAAAEPPFVNLTDPARALGPDGKPAVSRR